MRFPFLTKTGVLTLKASQTRGGGAGGGDWVGFQTDTKGGAEALLNKETLLNDSLWNFIKTTTAQWNL